MSARAWAITGGRTIPMDRPAIMAIVNATPDSFYEGGRWSSAQRAAEAALAAWRDGAAIIDIGGESTRPGAQRIDAAEQRRRVVPVIERVRAQSDVPISVDTTSAEVARAALDAGADAINDVSAGLEDPDLLTLAAARGCGLVLMHRLRAPEEDSYSDRYDAPPDYRGDVVGVVREFLRARRDAAIAAGVRAESVVLDPGLGFGKTVEQNLELIRRTGELASLGCAILSGLSRKSFVGRAAGLGESSPGDRLWASVGLGVAHWVAGASIFRVHDVAAHREALRAAWSAGSPPRPGCLDSPTGRP